MKFLMLILTLLNPPVKKDKVVINKTYQVDDPQEMVVVVENIFGDISVESSDADSDASIEKAKSELQFGETISDDSIVFYMKAPFLRRCKWGNEWSNHIKLDRDELGYEYKYQYTLKVPKEVTIDAHTVNNGDISITNIDGPIKANNVNGEIQIQNARQVLKASTVNGDVTISYIESPETSIAFNTVNGDFNFELPENFNAQVYFDSMHGEMYTSFDYRKLGPKVEKSQKHGTFKIGTKTGVEIGSGGPELSFKSINGDVYLKKIE